MKRVFLVFARIAVALIAGLVFFSTASFLSLMPRIVDGPFGFKSDNVGIAVWALSQLYPLEWFPIVSAMLVFWCVFRVSHHWALGPGTICFLIFGALIGVGISVACPIANMHGSWALSTREPSVQTVIFNYLMIGLFVVTVSTIEIGAWRRQRKVKSENENENGVKL
jgi:hypothetical protein